jgi:hypothetical protein
MSVIKGANLALRFLLELCALAALGYGAAQLPAPWPLRVVAAVAVIAVAAAVWGRWVAPRARHLLPDPLRLIPEWAVFGGATVSLVLTGHPILGAVFAALAATNRLALHLLRTTTGGARVDAH